MNDTIIGSKQIDCHENASMGLTTSQLIQFQNIGFANDCIKPCLSRRVRGKTAALLGTGSRTKRLPKRRCCAHIYFSPGDLETRRDSVREGVPNTAPLNPIMQRKNKE